MGTAKKKHTKCEDCDYCQSCSKTRCRLCKSGKKMQQGSGLARCFTYEEYQLWKMKKAKDEILKSGGYNATTGKG